MKVDIFARKTFFQKLFKKTALFGGHDSWASRLFEEAVCQSRLTIEVTVQTLLAKIGEACDTRMSKVSEKIETLAADKASTEMMMKRSSQSVQVACQTLLD